MQDYPAAHSMDATWFAVDEAGRIGYFETGETGVLPLRPPLGERWRSEHSLIDILAAALRTMELQDPRLRRHLPQSDAELRVRLEDAWFDEDTEGCVLDLARSVGVFVYCCKDDGPFPYERAGRVGAELVVTDLPHLAPTKPPGGNAADPVRKTRLLAPGEYGPVRSWAGPWVDTGGGVHGGPPREVERLRRMVPRRPAPADELDAVSPAERADLARRLFGPPPSTNPGLEP